MTPPKAPDVTRDGDAKRAKRYRARRRVGVRMVTVPIDEKQFESLEAKGYLDDGQNTLATAVTMYLADNLS